MRAMLERAANETPSRDRRHWHEFGAQPQASTSKPPAPDIYSSITPVFYVHKALGLACFSLREENNLTTIQYSPRGAAYNLCVIALALVVTVLANLGNLSQSYANQSLITSGMDEVQMYLPLVLMLTSLITARRQGRIIASIEKLGKIDKMLKHMDVQVPHKKNKRFLLTQLTVLCCGLAVVILIMNVFNCIIMEMDYIWGYLIGLDMSLVIYYMSESQLIAWLFALRQRFKLLNARMRDPTPVDEALVQAFAAAHSALCDVTEEINGVFAFQLFLIVLIYFVDFLLYSFFTVRTIIIISNGGNESLYGLAYDIYYSILISFMVLNVCLICSMLANEAKLSSYIVHATMRNTKHSSVRKYLKRFSLQLLHQKVCLTASGFFSLDLSLVFTMVATTTTYITILLQFDKQALIPQKSSSSSSVATSNSTLGRH